MTGTRDLRARWMQDPDFRAEYDVQDEATKSATMRPSAPFEAWRDEETRRAIREADAASLVTPEEVKAIIREFVPHG